MTKKYKYHKMLLNGLVCVLNQVPKIWNFLSPQFFINFAQTNLGPSACVCTRPTWSIKATNSYLVKGGKMLSVLLKVATPFARNCIWVDALCSDQKSTYEYWSSHSCYFGKVKGVPHSTPAPTLTGMALPWPAQGKELGLPSKGRTLLPKIR